MKTERWRLQSQRVIESLPRLCYGELACCPAPGKSEGEVATEPETVGQEKKKPRLDGPQDFRCVICMEEFEAAAELRLLPCRHYFHLDCTAGWLTVSHSH